MTDFPTLDADRTAAHAELGRMIMDVFGCVEPRIDELDYNWCAMPVRLVHDQAAGWHLEVGPYGLDRADIDVLREAIASYDAAATGTDA